MRGRPLRGGGGDQGGAGKLVVLEIDIAEVGIDELGRTLVRPSKGDFDMVYRAAMEVYWDKASRTLSHPNPPRDWTAVHWYRQIVAAVADEYNLALRLTARTVWTNVPAEMRQKIEEGMRQ